MKTVKKGTAIGKVVAGRVEGYPVFEESPKETPKKACWVVVPDYTAPALPRTLSEAAAGKDYRFTAHIFSATRTQAEAALDHLIVCGGDEIPAGDKRFWLHAVTYGIQRAGLFKVSLTYIFRARQIPEEILKEVK
jgi:hypothetical protein